MITARGGKSWVKGCAGLSLLLFAVVGAAFAANPDPPDWILGRDNWQKAEGTYPATNVKRLQAGEYEFGVLEVDREQYRNNYSKRFWAASEANRGRYDIDENGSIVDKTTGQSSPPFIFGLPFPDIDANDPQAGVKIIWNYKFRQWQGDGTGHDFYLPWLNTKREERRLQAYIARAFYTGRHGGPIEPNPQNFRYRQLIYVTSPLDLEGANTLTWRFNDSTSQDSVWAYVPSIRRVRRVNAATRSDPSVGSDCIIDDADCYDGKVEQFNWKLIGEGEVYAPILNTWKAQQIHKVNDHRWRLNVGGWKVAADDPASIEKGLVGWMPIDIRFIRNPVWIVEGTPKDPYYNWGKIHIYIDKVLYTGHFKDGYSRAMEYVGTLWCVQGWVKAQDHDGEYSSPVSEGVNCVNEKTNHASFPGHSQVFDFERKWDLEFFTTKNMMRLGK